MPYAVPSTLVQKVTMAITGIVLVVFVLGHVLGNLLVFRGPAALDGYAAALRHRPALLWSARAVLLAAFVLHVAVAASLTRTDRAARPLGNARVRRRAATVASRTIRVTGVAVLAFVAFHVLHLTTGTVRPAPFAVADVYGNVVRGFRVPWVVAVYLAAMVALGLHLWHGTWALVRTLGLARLRSNPQRRRLASLVAVGVWAGFTAIPLAVAAGVLGR